MPAQSLNHVRLCDLINYSPSGSSVHGQEYWNGLPFPPPGDLPNPGMETASPAPPALAGGFFTADPPGKANKAALPEIWVGKRIYRA